MWMHPIHRAALALALVALPTLVMFSVLTLLTACRPSAETVANGDDPIAALAVSAQSRRYTTDYWLAQVTTDSARWRRAVDYCRRPGIATNGAKPNCGFVTLAANRLQLDSMHARGVRTERARDQIDRNLFKP